MLAASASLLNIDVAILDVGEDAPAKQIVVSPPHIGHVDGSFADPSKIRELARKVDVLTVEIEHVNADVLEDISKETHVEVHPSPATIRIIQDKYAQKNHLRDRNVPVDDFTEVESSAEGVGSAV